MANKQIRYLEEEPYIIAYLLPLFVHQVNNTALAQVIVLPSPGSVQYNSVIQKVMNCHICFGKSSVFGH